MKYHEVIINLIKYILEKGQSYVDLLDSGNAYDKIIRNYHQFNHKGEQIYRKKNKISDYFKFSEKAWQKRDDIKSLYFEHTYPVKIIKQELNELITTGISSNKIEEILNKSEIVVLTKEEATLLDKRYKDKMPENSNDRLSEVGIIIERQTLDNSIFKDN